MNQKCLALTQDVVTRWNSTLHMIKRILERKEAVILLLSEADSTKHLLPSNNIWSIVESIVPILEVMEVCLKPFLINFLGFHQAILFQR